MDWKAARDGTAEPVFYDANGNEITVSDRVSVSPAEISTAWKSAR
ncbi:MAG: hypothetical protein ACLUD2_18135 [Clostridium sp.]